MMNIVPVGNPEQKAEICLSILHALPDWFGIETALQGYVRDVQVMSFWVTAE